MSGAVYGICAFEYNFIEDYDYETKHSKYL